MFSDVVLKKGIRDMKIYLKVNIKNKETSIKKVSFYNNHITL